MSPLKTWKERRQRQQIQTGREAGAPGGVRFSGGRTFPLTAWPGRSAGEEGGARPRRTRTTSSAISVPYTKTLCCPAAGAAGGGGAAMRRRLMGGVAELEATAAGRGRRRPGGWPGRAPSGRCLTSITIKPINS